MFLPLGSMDLDVTAGRVRPRYLGAGDIVWVEALMEEYDRHLGRPRKMLDERLSGPLPAHVPSRRAKAVRAVLDRMYQAKTMSPVSPEALRWALFERAAALSNRQSPSGWRSAVLREVGAEFGLTQEEVERCLYADVSSHRIVMGPAEPVALDDVVCRANLLVAQSLLYRSRLVLVQVEAGLEVVVRTAKMLGLICVVSAPGEMPSIHPFRRGVQLEISGPLSLFGKTLKYGRALSRLLPVLAWAPRWGIRAGVELSGHLLWYSVDHRDRVLPAGERPRRFDSKLEERFQRDFAKVAPDWDILREPEPVSSAGTFFFPDFALVWTRAPRRKILVELVGFWTPEYLSRKLRLLRQARLGDCILCVDESLGLGKESWTGMGPVLFFRRRVDAARVLAMARAILEVRPGSQLEIPVNGSKSIVDR